MALKYPHNKRLLSIPQLILGLAFTWGIKMVSAAETNTINHISLLVFSSCFFWIIAYDTAYALCDKDEDLNLGINSSAITFGGSVTLFFFCYHLISTLILLSVAYLEDFHFSFYIFSLISILLFIYQCILIKEQKSTDCLKAFKNNNWLGMYILMGSVLGVSL